MTGALVGNVVSDMGVSSGEVGIGRVGGFREWDAGRSGGFAGVAASARQACSTESYSATRISPP